MGLVRSVRRFMLVVAVALFTASTSYSLPSVNLGFTSFLDGAPPAGPGVYFQEYFQYYTADELTNKDGDDLGLPGVDISVLVAMSQVIYQSPDEWGVNVMLPIVSLDASDDFGILTDNGTGLGDLLIGPFWQWNPIMGEKGPKFMHRVELQFILPIGDYDDNKVLNQSSDYFSFNPYWAFTAFFTPQWTMSARIHYLWNAEKDNDQAGQAIHANFATAYELVPKQFRLGLNGYYLKQLTEDQKNGNDVPDTEQMAFAIGPGAVYHISQDDHLFFNYYQEIEAENRPKGMSTTLRWVHHF